MNLKKIRDELEFLSSYDVVIFGSYATEDSHSRSDIDIAIITGNSSYEENINLLKSIIGKAPPLYDIKIYELLPLKIKIDIADAFLTLFGNKLDILEYMYFYRKLWADNKYRIEENQFKNYREQVKAIKQMK